MTADLLRALDLAAARDWEGARAALEPSLDPVAVRLRGFISEVGRREELHRASYAELRHEIGNALAIVQANLEAVIDGVLEPTPERLGGMRQALSSAAALLEGLRRG